MAGINGSTFKNIQVQEQYKEKLYLFTVTPWRCSFGARIDRNRQSELGMRRCRPRSRSRSRSPPYRSRDSPRMEDMRGLRHQVSRPLPSNRYLTRKCSDEEYEARASKRRAMMPKISVWMESSPEPDATDKTVVETFKKERSKHIAERQQHRDRHQQAIDRRTAHSDRDSSDEHSSSISSSESSTDSEEERRRRRRRRRRKRKRKRERERERKRRSKDKHRKRRRKGDKRRKRKHKERDSTDSESESGSSKDIGVGALEDVNADNRNRAGKSGDKVEWVVKEEDVSSSTSSDSGNGDDDEEVGPKLVDDVTSKLDRRDYGGAMLPGEADAIANFVQRGMRIPRRGEVGLTSEEIAAFEQTGFVMSGSRHKRMNAIRIRKENQIYSAEEKRALTMVNFEEKLNREKKLMAQYQKLLNGKMRK